MNNQMKIQISEDALVLIKASDLSMKSRVMRHKPKNYREQWLYERLSSIIKRGNVEDFYRPKYDPSFTDETHTAIQFVAGKLPALEKTWNEWQDFLKGTDWSLGTKNQYIVFLGTLIQSLIESGWENAKAWDAVCNNSQKIGNYSDSKNRLTDNFELTGSREVCGFCDLSNTFKVLEEDKIERCFYVAGGCYMVNGKSSPLVNLDTSDYPTRILFFEVPWLVKKK